MQLVVGITVALLLPACECYYFPVLPSWCNQHAVNKYAPTKMSMGDKPTSMAPDRELFKSFFLSSIDPDTGGIGIDQLRRHDDLNMMLSHGNIETAWLYQTWTEVAGVDANHVDEATAYEVSCFCFIT